MRATLHTARILIGFSLLATQVAHAAVFAMAPAKRAEINGTPFEAGEVFGYDDENAATSLLLPAGSFDDKAAVDAVHARADGHLLISTKANGTLGGLKLKAGDVVDYDPVSRTAVIVLSESAFKGKNKNVDAVSVRPDGHLILSTAEGGVLGTLKFESDDLVDYDPDAATATIFMSRDRFTKPANIVGVHLNDDGSILLATAGDAELGGLAFHKGDVVRYDPASDRATLVHAVSDIFDGPAEVAALSVVASEETPSTGVPASSSGGIALLGALLLGIGNRLIRRP
jgi:hypothetical protein